MKYRDLIELYKEGKLEEEKRKQVENDIERQEAINEYLFEEGEIPELDVFEDNFANENELNGVDEEQLQFAKMINASIRKAFVKMGVTVGVVVLTLILFVIFALPQVVDLFYYNPAKVLGENENYPNATNQISLDLAVYSELFMPGYHRSNVIVDENGYGEYDINIVQNFTMTESFKNVAGKIEREKIVLYDPNFLEGPTGNAFVPNEAGVDGFGGTGAAGEYEDAMAKLQKLDEDDYYMAYVTLSDVMSYSEFVEWGDSKYVGADWCAICEKNSEGYYSDSIVGFIFSSSHHEMYYDKETYPYLTTYDVAMTTVESFDWEVSEDVMKKHVTSMLRYMSDQKTFNEMIVGNKDESDYYLQSYKQLADNVEEYGLNIYGFALVGQKDEILELSKLEEVAYIYTNPVK